MKRYSRFGWGVRAGVDRTRRTEEDQVINKMVDEQARRR